MCGRAFQGVGAVKETDLWPKVLLKTRGAVKLWESVDERRGLRHSERYVGAVSVKLLKKRKESRFCTGYETDTIYDTESEPVSACSGGRC